ncbi:hypothetical protein [Thiocapsa rosea]|uniref:hypothetical protein n=1 Tax=Thiocapsa rosea TaxID=69360 RepID=UPI0011C493F8|nr:hypothetical protein [Thiocapsa rosea]
MRTQSVEKVWHKDERLDRRAPKHLFYKTLHAALDIINRLHNRLGAAAAAREDLKAVYRIEFDNLTEHAT